ncbi:MAG: hypothetical protein Q9195_009604 [Heterodermia aff. obscurata]
MTKHARFKPFTFWVTDLGNYEGFIEFLNNAGFEIRDEDWRYTPQGILLTFPMRDHAWQFSKVMSGKDIEGLQVRFVRSNTQKDGPDTRNPVNAVPTEAAILDAFRHKYGPSTPVQATSSAVGQISSPVSLPLQRSDQSESDFEIEGNVDVEEDDDDEEYQDNENKSDAPPAVATVSLFKTKRKLIGPRIRVNGKATFVAIMVTQRVE